MVFNKNSSQLVVFDLDRTIVLDNCSFNFCRYLVARGILPSFCFFYSFLYYAQHLFFGLSLGGLHTKIFQRLLRGRSLKQLEQNVEPFLKEYLYSRANASVLAQLRLAHQLGHYTLILSNSPDFLVKKVAQILGVDEWRATKYAVDKESNLCHIDSIMQGEEKALCVNEVASRLSIAKEQITAYSDSILDLPLLLSAGKPVAVNPDRKLKRFSKLKNWLII